jgi:UDP-N-acetylmuramoyl-tripeptide--D-alanyl-D-alanine ligase
MAKPDIAVITNIGQCHLENLGTRDGILKAKTEMFSHMQPSGCAILNGDDDKLATQTVVNGRPAVFYGVSEGESSFPVYASQVKNLGFEGMEAQIHTQDGSFPVKISIPGEHNVYNALAATAVGLQLGLSLSEIKRGIEAAKTIAGRTNFLKINGMTVIDDCYNANPVSMKTALEILSHAKGRSIAVLGDMGELGTDERRLHYEVGTCAGERKITALFCAGELAEEYKKAAKLANPAGEVYYFTTREAMTEALLSYVQPEDTILVKASHFMEFPKVVEALNQL